MAETKRRAICEMHTDTRILYNVLETKFIKDGAAEVTYDELSAAIGRSVQVEARGLLATARKHLEREHALIIEPITGVGLKLTRDYAGVLDKKTAHIRRQSRSESRRVLNAISGKELDQSQQVQVAARLSALGAIQLFTKPAIPKRLTDYVAAHGSRELPTAETLKLFSGEKNGTKE